MLPKCNVPYSYHDYVTAWFRFMLHQNENNSHSWFVNFDKEFSSTLPLWFDRWWNQFGSIPDIFPDQLKVSFENFSKTFKVDSYGAKFLPLLHFIKRYKVPWILKWQYEKDGDVLRRRWFVKWWDRFPHTQSVVNNVARDFSSPNALPGIKINSPVQKAELANAHASTSVSTAKSSIKPKKKGSPLDGIRKDPDALYALLKLISKKKVSDDGSDDERSSEASVSKDPYYHYNQELFGHDEEDNPED
ncbi:hypothetical protein SO802_023109 [Lithocarpus litseifolius]|uniref:Uncharacterized protein n=1 Tax=Lithocarpus litseifolius TaxID=425828 RepID=A0AAW2C5B6_9ROSI